MSQVGGDTSSCCRDDLEGESGRVVRLECHDHHYMEGMMGDNDRYGESEGKPPQKLLPKY